MAENEEHNDFEGINDPPNLGDLNITGDTGCEEDAFFDSVIGHIEEILVDTSFVEMQQAFMEKYWQEFERGEENKLIYMTIFKEYEEVIEKHIETELSSKIPGFNMQSFIHVLQNRKSDLHGEVFEVLDTFSDFLAFKEMILDYRGMKEGKFADLTDNMIISKV